MKRLAVIEESAQIDLHESYDWGCRTWGKRETQQWARELRSAVLKQLAVTPKAFLAPENDEFFEEIRQMVVGRYRVLFTIKRRKVHVLHVRGAYVGPLNPVEDVSSS